MTRVAFPARRRRETAPPKPGAARGVWRLLIFLSFAGPSVLLALDPAKSVFQFNVQSWTRRDGLPSDKINTVVQTRDGYLWLGTQRGLVRYDGSEFKEVTPVFPTAGGTEVLMLAPSTTGALRVAINQGGYATLAGATFSEIDAQGWPAEPRSGRAIFEAHDGTVWVGSAFGVGHWVPGRPQDSFWNDTVLNARAFCEDLSGRIWIGTDDRGVFSFSDGRFTPFPDSSLLNEVILSLAPGASGELWVGTGRGLRCYDAQGHRVDLATTRDMVGSVSALLLDHHGTLWIGISGRGLVQCRNGVFNLYRKTDGLGSEFITALCEDAEGSLWIATRDGLTQLTDIRFPIYTSADGLMVGTGHTVSPGHNGGVWLTTSAGYSYFDGRKGQPTPDTALPTNRYIKLGLEAKNGDVYLADGDRTISIVSGGRIVASIHNEYWPEAIAEDAESVLVGIGADLFRIRNGRLELYAFRPARQPSFGYFANLMVAKDGAIWASTRNGIFRVKDGDYQFWGTAEGLSSPQVHFLLEDGDGSIWAGLPTGLARLRSNTIRNLTTANGLVADRVYAIVPDDLGNFWLATNRGIIRVSRANLNEVADGSSPRLDCEVFDGLESVKFSDRTEQGFSGCRSADGRIWFPNPQGMVMIDPAKFFHNHVSPPVHIQQIRIDGKDVPNPHAPVLTPGVQRMEISFAILSFIAPKKIQIRYQLDGFDAAWIDAGSRRSALYSNLSPGHYEFRVQARNADGVWNMTGDSVAFVLPPRYYQTAWFYTGCAGLAGLILLGLHRWRVQWLEVQRRRLQEQNDLLEAKVGKRTDELANSVSLLQATIESTADGIIAVHSNGEVISSNSQFASMWGFRPEQLAKARGSELVAAMAALVDDPKRFAARVAEIRANPERDAFDLLELKDGRTIERYSKPQRVQGKCVGMVINFRDITARKKAAAELAQVNGQLLDASREAGMAEIATNVLHNVGNVLNSVNVSASIVMDRTRRSHAAGLPKVAAILKEHAMQVGGYLADDPKGRKIPQYVEVLARELESEQHAIVSELASLCRQVDHIKEIVAMQQSYARVSGLVENLGACDLVDDAIRINAAALAETKPEVIREYSDRPIVAVDRHKVVQILVNLINNATLACQDARVAATTVKAHVARNNGLVRISITDNGVGIAPENLTRIFEHGFTTRKHGHGFGLHSCALAAKELGGSLRATSPGVGQGATFTLELPAAPDAKP